MFIFPFLRVVHALNKTKYKQRFYRLSFYGGFDEVSNCFFFVSGARMGIQASHCHPRSWLWFRDSRFRWKGQSPFRFRRSQHRCQRCPGRRTGGATFAVRKEKRFKKLLKHFRKVQKITVHPKGSHLKSIIIFLNFFDATLKKKMFVKKTVSQIHFVDLSELDFLIFETF